MEEEDGKMNANFANLSMAVLFILVAIAFSLGGIVREFRRARVGAKVVGNGGGKILLGLCFLTLGWIAFVRSTNQLPETMKPKGFYALCQEGGGAYVVGAENGKATWIPGKAFAFPEDLILLPSCSKRNRVSPHKTPTGETLLFISKN